MTASDVHDVPSPNYDLILVAGGSFRDIDGRLISRWDPEEVSRGESLSELSERVDFAERVLAQPHPAEDQSGSTLRS